MEINPPLRGGKLKKLPSAHYVLKFSFPFRNPFYRFNTMETKLQSHDVSCPKSTWIRPTLIFGFT
jgi:hypothetical protein